MLGTKGQVDKQVVELTPEMVKGALAGIVPALGFLIFGPLLEEKIRLHGPAESTTFMAGWV